jgi:hypothetical protein
MGDTPLPREPLQIPKPSTEEIKEVPASNVTSQSEALKEQSGFSGGSESVLKQGRMDWSQRYYLKWVIVGFVLMINIAWIANVLLMVWFSGYDTHGFHLDNSVLIVLVSTSVGTFIALVAIVAKSLFPSDPKDSQAK